MSGCVSDSYKATLCWDCGNACGGCSWSKEFIPVEGWEARPVKQTCGNQSYIVFECPQFVRDAKDRGFHRLDWVKPKRKWKKKKKKVL